MDRWNELVDFYNGKKILITGHTGFKGAWITKILVMLGAEVTGYALNPPTEENLFDILELSSEVDSVIGDIRDLKHLKEVFDRVNPELVLHMAALQQNHICVFLSYPRHIAEKLFSRKQQHLDEYNNP